MKININDFGKDFFGFMQQSHRDMSIDSIKASLKEIFTKESLQMATFTITEKGYCLVNGKEGLCKGRQYLISTVFIELILCL